MAGNLILINGHLITSDPAMPVAQAVAIRNGLIAAVGANDDALAERCADTDVLDLHGRTATAAFNDAHCHPMHVGFAAAAVNARPEETSSIAQLVARIRERAESQPPDRWIRARGYDDARFAERRHPNRADLDRAAPEHAVFVVRACGHIAAVNTKALQRAGITAATPDPEGGVIDRDEHGEPTGILRETAMRFVSDVIQEPSVDEIVEALDRAAALYHAVGVTSVAEAGIHRPEEMTAYQALHDRGAGGLRTYLMMMVDEMLDGLEQTGIRTGLGDARLRIGPAKLFIDGSIGGRTARMHHPYRGEAENVGLWMQTPHALKTKFKRAHDLGWQCCAHAIGDAAIDLLLDCYEEAMTANPRPNPRHRIEHCEFITDIAVFDRIKRLGCIPIPGTTFLRDFHPVYLQNLGPERLRYANAMRTFIDRGIIAAASSDAPVVTVSPLAGIETMVTRKDFAGDVAHPEEAITFAEAVWAYTSAGAYASFEEKLKGSLTPGKLGDVTVLSADARTVDPDDIAEMTVDYTIMDGDIVYRA
ncbi:MAG: amidohydrolase [Thermomicrobia bacterium]|nr:amidohydrolase [Thermomicrobia bacterium]